MHHQILVFSYHVIWQQVALLVPNYKEEISYPMDLSTIRSKLLKYKSVVEFEKDIRLMFENCIQFNGEESDLCQVGSSANINNIYMQYRIIR